MPTQPSRGFSTSSESRCSRAPGNPVRPELDERLDECHHAGATGFAQDSEIEVAFGSFDTTRAQGNLNVPLRNAAVRLSPSWPRNSDGWVRNSVDDRPFGRGRLLGAAGFAVGFDLRRCLTSWTSWRNTSATTEAAATSGRRTPISSVDPHDIRLTTVTLENPYLISEIDNLDVNLGYDLGFATLRSITGYVHSEVLECR